jgi:hypothetical protein
MPPQIICTYASVDEGETCMSPPHGGTYASALPHRMTADMPLPMIGTYLPEESHAYVSESDRYPSHC